MIALRILGNYLYIYIYFRMTHSSAQRAISAALGAYIAADKICL